jgi:hypothetical protein
VSASVRHSVELQRHLAVIPKRRLSSEQANSFEVLIMKMGFTSVSLVSLRQDSLSCAALPQLVETPMSTACLLRLKPTLLSS